MIELCVDLTNGDDERAEQTWYGWLEQDSEDHPAAIRWSRADVHVVLINEEPRYRATVICPNRNPGAAYFMAVVDALDKEAERADYEYRVLLNRAGEPRLLQ